MAAACVHPLPLYRPRDPQASDLWRLMDRHFETFQRVYDEPERRLMLPVVSSLYSAPVRSK